jgi:hypothetical protein
MSAIAGWIDKPTLRAPPRPAASMQGKGGHTMARVVPFHPSLAPQAVARAPRARAAIGRVTAVGALVSVLSVVGSCVFAAGRRMERSFVAWVEAHREREADRKLWAMALQDPRLMADLVALRQHADSTQH